MFSNVLEYKPGPIGELPVDGFPHHMDDAGYRSDGQHPCEDRRNWHGKRHPLSINRGLCIPAYHLQINPRDNGDRVLIPCLLTPDEKGKLEQEVSIAASRSVEVINVPVVRYALLTQFLSENDRFEDDTEVPNFVYPWDDATDDLFTRDRKRLDQEYGKETEFPADVPERRLRMHPKKLARRLELFTAVLTMLRPINRSSQFCKNVWEAQKRQEQLHEAHFDYLNKLRRLMNELNHTFPLAFALSKQGRCLETADAAWAAVMASTTRTHVEFADPPKEGRSVTPVAQTVFTDLPPHASLYFKRKDKLSVLQRAKIANIILELCAYSLCIPPTHGMTIHHDKSCHDKELMNDSILWLMGHKFDSDAQERIDRRHHHIVNMWRQGLLVSHHKSFSNTNHFMRANPAVYTTDWFTHSESALTDRDSDDSDRSAEEEPSSSKTVSDEQKQAFNRFLDRTAHEVRNIARLVDRCTQLGERRWHALIDWEKPESLMKMTRLESRSTLGSRRFVASTTRI